MARSLAPCAIPTTPIATTANASCTGSGQKAAATAAAANMLQPQI